jgi:hypothetical protein
MSTTKGRVQMPRNPKESFELANKIYAKHLADADASPLDQLEDYSWDNVGPTVQNGLDFHIKAEELKGQMELLYRQRDAIFKNVDGINKASGAYLKGKYPKTPKKLTEWGFEVDDTPHAKKNKATTA